MTRLGPAIWAIVIGAAALPAGIGAQADTAAAARRAASAVYQPRPIFEVAKNWGRNEHTLDLGMGAIVPKPAPSDRDRLDWLPWKVEEGLHAVWDFVAARELATTAGFSVIEHGPQEGLVYDAYTGNEQHPHQPNTKLRQRWDSKLINPEMGRSSASMGLWLRMDWMPWRPRTETLPVPTKSLRGIVRKRLPLSAGLGVSTFIDPRGYRPGIGAFAVGSFVPGWDVQAEIRRAFGGPAGHWHGGLRFRFGGRS
jgi:hypothetical protein